MKIKIEYKIKQIREEKGLSLRELADLAGISHSTIRYVENEQRQPTLYVLICIAIALNVKPTDLYTYCKL